MEISIQQISAENAALLDRVAEDVFDRAISPERLTAYLEDPGHLLCVACAGDLVVGQARAVIHHQPDKAPDLYIDNLGVASAYQRQGIAKRLLTALIDLGRARGCGEVWVSTEPENEAAIACYRSLGLKMETMVYFETDL